MNPDDHSRLERLQKQIDGLASVCADLTRRVPAGPGSSEIVETCRKLTEAYLWAGSALERGQVER